MCYDEDYASHATLEFFSQVVHFEQVKKLPRLVVVSGSDISEEFRQLNLADIEEFFSHSQLECSIMQVSAKSGQGIEDSLKTILSFMKQHKEKVRRSHVHSFYQFVESKFTCFQQLGKMNEHVSFLPFLCAAS